MKRFIYIFVLLHRSGLVSISKQIDSHVPRIIPRSNSEQSEVTFSIAACFLITNKGKQSHLIRFCDQKNFHFLSLHLNRSFSSDFGDLTRKRSMYPLEENTRVDISTGLRIDVRNVTYEMLRTKCCRSNRPSTG